METDDSRPVLSNLRENRIEAGCDVRELVRRIRPYEVRLPDRVENAKLHLVHRPGRDLGEHEIGEAGVDNPGNPASDEETDRRADDREARDQPESMDSRERLADDYGGSHRDIYRH